MKRAVISDEISSDITIAAQLAAQHGLYGLEIRNVFGVGAHELSGAQLETIDQTAKQYGLAIVAIASSAFKCDLHDDAFEEHLAILKPCFTVARMLGTNIIRVFSFWQSLSWEDALPLIVPKLHIAADLAQKAGMILVLESDPGVYATNAKKLADIIEAVDSPALKALWDPGNDLYDPDHETPYPDGYLRIKPHIRHMHVKDARRNADGTSQCLPFGKGAVDWRGQIKALLSDGYQGVLSLETHYRVGQQLDHTLLKQPKGHTFSDGAYEATQESLTLWDDMWRELVE